MMSTIDKYKNTKSGESNTCTREEINAQFYLQESKKLRQQIDILQISNRQLKGERLDSLNLNDMKQLETRLEKAIARISMTKILEEIEYLQKREIELEHDNTILRLTIAENERVQQEVDAASYHALEAYLARNALQLNIMLI
ncbi:hypothetical protein L1987_08740 [Smallanthus sonchifolius]|uniref:Uncharacterized protein n=1 Tax=Smallanthus sonchifolius TaxID=185202 RepID=A0ACB9JM00_9ASTR|nr:hypothetical protein L1987_08740 [Smallanthus sonchifolius]